MKHPKNEKKGTIWLILAVLFAAGALPCAFWTATQFGAVFLGALAVGCAGEGLCVRWSARSRLAHGVSMLGRVLFALFVVSFAAIQGLICAGMYADPEAGQAEYLLVLGAHIYEDRPSEALAARLDTAAALLAEHPDMTAILCGGQGSDEPMPEAEMMEDYLLARGVDESRLLLETESSNTIQNIAHAKALYDLEAHTTAVVTSDFHLARARRLMAQAGLDAVGVPAPTPHLGVRLVSHMREYGSTLGLILTGRYF